MVPKKSRVPRTGFESSGSRVLRSPYFSVKVRKNALAKNRIAVVVGKSVDKRAVRRNFLKRQAKVQLLKLSPAGVDFIMTIYPKANALAKTQFIEEIKKILN